jgi:hypothetical protein
LAPHSEKTVIKELAKDFFGKKMMFLKNLVFVWGTKIKFMQNDLNMSRSWSSTERFQLFAKRCISVYEGIIRGNV